MTDDGCIPLSESATNDTRTLAQRIERIRLVLNHDNFASATDINDFESIASYARYATAIEAHSGKRFRLIIHDNWEDGCPMCGDIR